MSIEQVLKSLVNSIWTNSAQARDRLFMRESKNRSYPEMFFTDVDIDEQRVSFFFFLTEELTLMHKIGPFGVRR